MAGSVGEIAERILSEVRSAKLTKLAEHTIVKEASAEPEMKTEIGRTLMKIAADLRSEKLGVTEEDLERFIYGR